MMKRPSKIRFLLLCMGFILSGCTDKKNSEDPSEVIEISSERHEDTEEKKTVITDFEEKYGFPISEITTETAETEISGDGIQMTIYSQQDLTKDSDRQYETIQFLEMDHKIGEFGIRYTLVDRPLKESIWDVEAFTVREYNEKKYKFKSHYNADTNKVGLFYPVDDDHFVEIEVVILDLFQEDGNRIWWDREIDHFTDQPDFYKLFLFEVPVSDTFSKDPYEVIIPQEQNDWIDIGDSYVDEWGEIEEYEGIKYKKNCLSFMTEFSITPAEGRRLVEELGREYSFYVVSYLEMTGTFEITFTEDKSFEELEQLGEKFEELDWLECCYPEVILEITFN